MNKRWLFALALVPILALGLGLREVMSRRPQRLTVLGTGATNPLRISVSPDGKWLLARFASIPMGRGALSIVELPTGHPRTMFGEFSHRARWTSDSRLAFTEEKNASSRLIFLNPRTLRPSVTFSPTVAGDAKVLSWSESQGNVWLLTRHQRLRFDMNGRFQSRSPFGARPSKPLQVGEVDISSDGENARVRDFFWDLNKDRRSTLQVSAHNDEFQWVGNQHYFMGSDLMLVNIPLNVDGTSWPRQTLTNFTLDSTGSFFATASPIEGRVRIYDAETAKLLEDKPLPSFPSRWDSWALSPKRDWMFVTRGPEIWRARLK